MALHACCLFYITLIVLPLHLVILADAFIQSDLQRCIHISHQEQLGVQCLAQGRFHRESLQPAVMELELHSQPS